MKGDLGDIGYKLMWWSKPIIIIAVAEHQKGTP